MPKAHDSAQLQSTVTGPMPKAHIRAQLKSTSKLIASCTNHDSLPVTARVAAAADHDHWHDSSARASLAAPAAASQACNDAEGS